MRIRTVGFAILGLSIAAAAASTLGRDGIAAYRKLAGLNLVVVAASPDGSVVIGGAASGGGLPVTDNAIAKTFSAGTCIAGGSPYPYYTCTEGYIARFAPDGTLLYGTYLTGARDVTVASVAVGPDGAIYAVLHANAGVNGIANPPSMDGASHAYVVVIDPAKAGFRAAFQVNEASRITVAKMAIDRAGNIYLGGSCAMAPYASLRSVVEAGRSFAAEAPAGRASASWG